MFFVSFLFPFPVILVNDSLWFPFPHSGNAFFHSLPVPELREWNYPFLFPNSQMSFPHFCCKNDLPTLSGKFLRVILCRLESFDFLCLCSWPSLTGTWHCACLQSLWCQRWKSKGLSRRKRPQTERIQVLSFRIFFIDLLLTDFFQMSSWLWQWGLDLREETRGISISECDHNQVTLCFVKRVWTLLLITKNIARIANAV